MPSTIAHYQSWGQYDCPQQCNWCFQLLDVSFVARIWSVNTHYPCAVQIVEGIKADFGRVWKTLIFRSQRGNLTASVTLITRQRENSVDQVIKAHVLERCTRIHTLFIHTYTHCIHTQTRTVYTHLYIHKDVVTFKTTSWQRPCEIEERKMTTLLAGLS